MFQSAPMEGRSYEEILKDLNGFSCNDPNFREAKTWSLVYYLNEEYEQFLLQAYGKHFSANGLNPTAFKSLKHMEKEVLKFTAELFHVDEKACGVMTSCGTESCLLAVKAYRDLAYSRGIRHPEMILSEVSHVAWYKASEYFGVKIRKAPLDKNYQIDIQAVRKLINKNTCMILGSAPEYPHGVIDPIEALGELAQVHRIPLHVDGCVGGYLLPFMEMNGVPVPKWDFRVPGVTSISADIHKYGFAAKGASCILYRSMDYFKYQCFASEDWPGGVFASPALLGSRPGGAYAAAWAAIQANGINGYRELTRKTIENAKALKKGILEMGCWEIIGNPQASLFAYRSTDPAVNAFSVGDLMEKKGWHIDRLQRPDGLHAMVLPTHEKVIGQYLTDLWEATDYARLHPELADQGQAATYGLVSHVPLRKMVHKQVLQMFADSYRLDAKEIDISDSSSMTPGGNPGKRSFADKLLSWYVKKSGKRRSRS